MADTVSSGFLTVDAKVVLGVCRKGFRLENMNFNIGAKLQNKNEYVSCRTYLFWVKCDNCERCDTFWVDLFGILNIKL